LERGGEKNSKLHFPFKFYIDHPIAPTRLVGHENDGFHDKSPCAHGQPPSSLSRRRFHPAALHPGAENENGTCPFAVSRVESTKLSADRQINLLTISLAF
jgi:hypothetical protein